MTAAEPPVTGTVTLVSGCFYCRRPIRKAKHTQDPWAAIPGQGQKLEPDVAVCCSSAESPDGAHHPPGEAGVTA